MDPTPSRNPAIHLLLSVSLVIRGKGPITLKRLILLVAVAVLTPVLANAQSWWGGADPNDDGHHHRHISGNEMAAAGFAGAALLAGAGYLALRRREKS